MAHPPDARRKSQLGPHAVRERRRSPRIEILGRLHGQVVSVGEPVTLRDISLGGMMIETTFAFPVGAFDSFRLTLGDGSTTVVRGRIVRCHRISGSDEDPVYVSGVEFTEDAENESPVVDIVEKLEE